MKTRTKGGKSRMKSAMVALAGGMIVALTAFVPGFPENFLDNDRAFADVAVYAPGKPAPREDLVLLGIDEDSLTLQGLSQEMIEGDEILSLMSERFPWNRRVYAAAIDKVLGAGAKVVVLDLVLSEASTPEADQAFIDVLNKYPGQIVMASVFAPLSDGEGFALLEPHHTFLEIENPPLLGFVNFRPDAEDLMIRTVQYSSSLSQENMQPPIEGELSFDSIAGAVLRAVDQPADRDSANIRFAVEEGESTFLGFAEEDASNVYKSISIRNLFIENEWENRYGNGDFFKDRIALIGPATARFQDSHRTPVGLLLGPQLHLQAIGAGLGKNFVESPLDRLYRDIILKANGDSGESATTWRVYLGVLLTASLGAVLAAILIYFISRPLVALLGTGLIIGTTVYGTFLVGEIAAFWIGPTSFSVALFLGAVSGQSYDLIRERLERSRLHGQFRRFVSRDVADSLVNDPSIYQQAAAGRNRRVIVLFSDIRGFTSISEQVTPEQLFSQLNEYFTAMVKIIFIHKGTLDKFIGDAILAHWGALEDGDESDFANSALAATEAMIIDLERLNADWKSRGMPVLGIGIGLHLGDVLAGEIGSEQRTEFGVIGDAVNLASRLEGMTKAFSSKWLASGQLIESTGRQAELRRVARVRVKGREEPVDLWTMPFCAGSREKYEVIRNLFEAGDFEGAHEKMEQYMAEYPDDTVAQHLLEHIQNFRENPPENWEGIIRFTEK
ncbi:MAG: adenylate/guanylate cyclase domain-containing protein [Luteolibacter sp.]